MMEKNVGNTDKIIRAVLAVVFIFLGYRYSYWYYAVAVILVFTIVTSFCGLYKLLGIKTCKANIKR